MPILDRPIPYHLVLPLQELERTIHGGGPSEVAVDIVFTPTKDTTAPHPDMPAKALARFSMMHGRLEVRLVDVVPTPEQARWMEEHRARQTELQADDKAAREAAENDLAERQADGRWQPGVGSSREEVPAHAIANMPTPRPGQCGVCGEADHSEEWKHDVAPAAR